MNVQDLTLLCHHLVRPYLAHGGAVVDATAGNGHDTEFLARTVGSEGRVYAIDAHEDAIASTRKKLEMAEVLDRVTLLLGRHEKFHELLPDSLRGEIHGFMFNLGYRPGGDKSFVTRKDTTIQALKNCQSWLAPGGFISVLAYRGHDGGPDEAAAVLAWLSALLPVDYETLRCDVPNASDQSPVLFLVRRQKHRPGA